MYFSGYVPSSNVMAKRKQHQTDFDDIIYNQIASEAEEKSINQNRVRFELSKDEKANNIKREHKEVSFVVNIGKQPPIIGNPQPTNRNQKRRLRRKKAKEALKSQTTPQPTTTARPGPHIVIYCGNSHGPTATPGTEQLDHS